MANRLAVHMPMWLTRITSERSFGKKLILFNHNHKPMHFLQLFRSQKIGLYLLIVSFHLSTLAHAESACANPGFPGCQAPSKQKALKIAIMIDESGSVTNQQQERIRQATIAYATELAERGEQNSTGGTSGLQFF